MTWKNLPMRIALIAALPVAILACCIVARPVPSPPDSDRGGGGFDFSTVMLQRIHTGLESPVDLQASPDGTGRLFILEQPGRIRVSDGGALQDADDAFLDIRDLVISSGNEQGLLGLAFHPDFATNGRFYVNYTQSNEGAGDDDDAGGDAEAEGDAGNTVLAEYTVSADPNRADLASARVLLRIAQPYANHNGGQLQFGPDGMLYMGTGDGGLACDPDDNAQDPQSLLGKMLRLHVDRPPTYTPTDNPFANDPSGRGEIWAIGLRNPWRFCFDSQTGELFIADVGQQGREEINVVTVDPGRPLNFGWRTWEGTLSPPPICVASDFEVRDAVAPVVEYGHDAGCSITGGYVYRGQAIPGLAGYYFYADFCSAFIRVFQYENGAAASAFDVTAEIAPTDTTLNNPTSFGIDADGELYVLDRDGEVFKLIARP